MDSPIQPCSRRANRTARRMWAAVAALLLGCRAQAQADPAGHAVTTPPAPDTPITAQTTTSATHRPAPISADPAHSSGSQHHGSKPHHTAVAGSPAIQPPLVITARLDTRPPPARPRRAAVGQTTAVTYASAEAEALPTPQARAPALQQAASSPGPQPAASPALIIAVAVVGAVAALAALAASAYYLRRRLLAGGRSGAASPHPPSPATPPGGVRGLSWNTLTRGASATLADFNSPADLALARHQELSRSGTSSPLSASSCESPGGTGPPNVRSSGSLGLYRVSQPPRWAVAWLAGWMPGWCWLPAAGCCWCGGALSPTAPWALLLPACLQVRTGSALGGSPSSTIKMRRGSRLGVWQQQPGSGAAPDPPAAAAAASEAAPEPEELRQHSSPRAVLHQAVMAIRRGGQGLVGRAPVTFGQDVSFDAELAELEDVDLASESYSPIRSAASGSEAARAPPGALPAGGPLVMQRAARAAAQPGPVAEATEKPGSQVAQQ
jgi:hypothetical protein